MSSLTYQRGEYFLLMRTLSGGHTRPARPTDHLCASRKPGSGEAHSNSSPLDWGKPCAWKPHMKIFQSGLFWELRRFSIPTAALAPHSIPKRLVDSHDQQKWKFGNVFKHALNTSISILLLLELCLLATVIGREWNASSSPEVPCQKTTSEVWT